MSIKCHQSPYLSTRGLYNLNLKNTYLGLPCDWSSAYLKGKKKKKKEYPNLKKKINTESVYSA